MEETEEVTNDHDSDMPDSLPGGSGNAPSSAGRSPEDSGKSEGRQPKAGKGRPRKAKPRSVRPQKQNRLTKVEKKYNFDLSRTKVFDVPIKLLEDLRDAVMKGMFADPYRAVGMTQVQFNEWMARGQSGEEGYWDFYAFVEKARVDAEMWHLENIKNQADKKWVASAWILERTFPEKYAKGQDRVVNVVHHKAPELPQNVTIIDVTNELDKRLTDGEE